MSTAFDAFLAQSAAEHAADVARRARIDADPLVIRLRAIIDAIEHPFPAYGTAGGLQVFADLASARNTRRLRAHDLLRGRTLQLDGQSAADLIARAARRRITEMERAAAEAAERSAA